MRALLTAVIAAIEAAAVALAVFAVIGIPAVLIWWLSFDLGAEPEALASAIAALWQVAHFVPMQLTVSAQAALGLGLPAAELVMPFSLAPLALTLGTALLAYRSGARFANRGGEGAWALVGGIGGFAGAAWATGLLAANLSVWPQWARVVVPAAVYAIAMVFGFVLRAAQDDHEWWQGFVRSLQKLVANLAPTGAAALPERAGEALRLAAGGLLTLLILGALGVGVAIVAGYVDIITLSQGLQLNVFGVLALFVLQLMYLPTAWVWAISWFAGPGFAVGAATSVTPFDTLLGPLPVLPLFGALPSSWGWAGGLAPAIVVVIGTVLGGLAGGRPMMRRASAVVAIAVPVCAALSVGLVVALFSVLASGAIGPGRLAETGPVWWQVGGFVALELAFGMSLGVFARRFDVARLRTMVPVSLQRDEDLLHGEPGLPHERLVASDGFGAPDSTLGSGRIALDEDLMATQPVEPLREAQFADEQPTVEIEPLGAVAADIDDDAVHFDRISERTAASVVEPALVEPVEVKLEPAPVELVETKFEVDELAHLDRLDEPEPEPEPEPAEAVDPLLQAFSWDAATPEVPAAEPGTRDWRSRMRSKLGRED